MEKNDAWTGISVKEIKELDALCAEYMDFLTNGKTERLCAELAVNMAKKAGYRDIKAYIENGKRLKAGDKVYAQNMNKMVVIFQIGKNR